MSKWKKEGARFFYGLILGMIITLVSWQNAMAAPTFTAKVGTTVVNKDDILNLKEGISFELFIDAQRDPLKPNSTLDFDVNNPPNWMQKVTISDTQWLWKGTPPADTMTTTLADSSVRQETGIELFVLENGATPSKLLPITLNVENNNTEPKLTGTPVTSVDQGGTYNYPIGVDDLDKIHGDTMTWQLLYNGVAPPPEGFWLELTADPNEPENIYKRILKNVVGRPDNDDVFKDGKLANEYPIEIKITDTGNLSNAVQFTITVNNTNDKPAIARDTAPENRVLQGEVFSYNIAVTDIDASDVISYGKSTIPDWLVLVNDPDDPFNSFKRILKNRDGRPNNSDVKPEPYVIKIVATDSGSPPLDDEFEFSVTVVNKNDAPIIQGKNVPPPAATQGIPYSLPITVVDIDKDELVYELTDKDGNALPETFWLTLSDPPPQRAEGPFTKNLVSKQDRPNNDDVFAGPYELKIIVTDKGVTDGQPDAKSDEWPFTITVLNKNDAPVISRAVAPPTTVNQDIPYEYQVVATDIDINDVLTFEPVKLPDWLELKDLPLPTRQVEKKTLIISKTGRPNNQDVRTEPYEVEIKVTDNGKTPDGRSSDLLSDTLSFQITVVNVNDPPVWITTAAPPNSVNQGGSYSFTLDVDDPDKLHGQTIASFDIAPADGYNQPEWLELVPDQKRVDDTYRRILKNKTGRPNNDDVGIYVFSVTASDSADPALKTDPKEFTIFVKNVNDAPTVTTKEPIPVMEIGKTYEVFIVADDVDKYSEGKPAELTDQMPPELDWDVNRLNYMIRNQLNWMAWDRLAKKLTFTPPAELFDASSEQIVKKISGGSLIVSDVLNNPDNPKSDELLLNLIVAKPGAVVIKGDFNLDGSVSLDDAIIILQILADIVPPVELQLFNEIDILEDGRIGIEDLLHILQEITVEETGTTTTTTTVDATTTTTAAATTTTTAAATTTTVAATTTTTTTPAR